MELLINAHSRNFLLLLLHSIFIHLYRQPIIIKYTSVCVYLVVMYIRSLVFYHFLT